MRLSHFFLLIAATQVPSQRYAATQAQSDRTTPTRPARLTIIAPADPAYDFGAARAGQLVSHTFLLRNDGKTTLHLDRLDTDTGCRAVLVAANNRRPAARPRSLDLLPPGGTVGVRVELDTAKLAPTSTSTLAADESRRHAVRVWVKGQAAHPVAVLEMRGQVTRGISFIPAVLDFGRIEAARGANRQVRMVVDKDRFDLEKTRLVADGAQLSVTEENVPEASPPGLVVRTYRVTMPPGSAGGSLRGLLHVEGLKPADENTSQVLPYSAEVASTLRAEPGTLLFGRVKFEGSEFATSRLRTRWSLLTCDPAKATAEADASWLEAEIVPPGSSGAISPPPLPPSRREAAKAGQPCWLRVTLTDTMPHATPLKATVTIRAANGETTQVIVYAERE